VLREKIKNYFQYKNPSNYNYLPRELDSMNFKIIYTKKTRLYYDAYNFLSFSYIY